MSGNIRIITIFVFTLLILSFQNCRLFKNEELVQWSPENCLTIQDLEIVSFEDVTEDNLYTFYIQKRKKTTSREVASRPQIKWFFNDALVNEDADSLSKKITDCGEHTIMARLNSCNQDLEVSKIFKKACRQ